MAVATIDDLDGTIGATTRAFALLNGDLMEIDLVDKNWEAFVAAQQKAIAKFVEKARPREVAHAVPAHRKRQAKRTTVASPSGADQNAAIRAWAQQNEIKSASGKLVGNRGRIPPDVVDQFNAAHQPSIQFSHAS